jgi:hypothetical protein
MSFTDRLVERIRAEYQAMPALKLTEEQACRLWGVGHDTCAAALRVLIAEGFLHQTGTGKLVALPRPAGASLTAPSDEPATLSVRCPNCGKRHTIERSRTVHGHAMSSTFRCAGCQRIVSVAEISA